MEEKYNEVSLQKLKLIPTTSGNDLIAQTSADYKFYEYESEAIGWYNNLEEAKDALGKYTETESDVIVYEIVGPEYGFGKSELVFNEENSLDDISEDEASDESPEYHLLFDSHKRLISSYFYDKENPGGNRLNGEKIFHKGDIAYLRDSIYVDDNNYNLLIPVEIEGKVTKEYLENKWRNAIKEGDKQIQGENAVEDPSEERIQRKIDSLLNIEKDSLVFRPLVTVKCNWGEEPHTPFDDAPRMDFITF